MNPQSASIQPQAAIPLRSLLTDFNLASSDTSAADLLVNAVTDDSRRAGPGTLFVAIAGTKLDGHEYLNAAAERGSTVALVNRRDLSPPAGMTLIPVDNTRRALALIASRLVGDPTRSMKVLGITGTNGKTTITYLLESILSSAGFKTGVLGTVNYRWSGHEESAPNTTPSPTQIADFFAQMKQAGVEAAAMEISSHALAQHRVDGVRFVAAGFTNLTQDHLDYHRDMDDYRRAKQRLFSEILPSNPDAVAVLNLDDEAGVGYADAARAAGARVLGYSLRRAEAQIRAENVVVHAQGMTIETFIHGESLKIETPLKGFFNVQNCLAATGLAVAAGVSREALLSGIAAFRGAPGRFEFIDAGQPFPVIVDYAHTPDSLLQLVHNARGFAKDRLIIVFGCGGDRDSGKRPMMGQAAARFADHVIVTNDNPRTEDPQHIADQILEGIHSVKKPQLVLDVCLDRREAIQRAIGTAGERDAVVIAGKGHEDYQILGPKKIHFDDREIAREILSALNLKTQNPKSETT